MWKNCNVFMVTTNKKSKLWLDKYNELFEHDIDFISKKGINQHLYITSDEEIKEGFKGYAIAILKEDNRIKELIEVITVQEDGCNRYTSIEYQQFSFKYHSIYPIITTTDELLLKCNDGSGFYSAPQPSQQFIEKYIEEHNKGNVITKVSVEYVFDKEYVDKQDAYGYDKIKLKVNPDNTINIKPIKDSWNREEVIKLFAKYEEDVYLKHKANITNISTKTWLKNNL